MKRFAKLFLLFLLMQLGLFSAVQANTSGWVCQETDMFGDYNKDCKVDIKDFAALANVWLTEMKFEDTIVVMTYNIHHGEGVDDVFDLQRIADIIKRTGADIVSLNEVDSNFRSRSDYLKEAKILADQFGMNYVFGEAIVEGEDHYYGNAILSRYPILTSKNHELYYYDGSERRACLHAVVETPLGRFNVYSTHLDNSATYGLAQQVDDLINITSGKKKVILMGDFNQETPRYSSSSQLRNLLMKYTYAFNVAGVGEPWTLVGSDRKFDFIFVSTEFYKLIKKCKVIRDGAAAVASDHYPLLMELSQIK